MKDPEMKDYPVLPGYNHKRKRETGESGPAKEMEAEVRDGGGGIGRPAAAGFEDGRSGPDPRQASSL